MKRKRAIGSSDGMGGHELYGTWANMIDRCYNEKSQNYRRYGGRGISVHPDWHSAKTFIEYMSPRPHKGLQIDRINNDGNYEPGNVRWATRTENVRNRSVTLRMDHNGKNVPLAEVVDESGLEYHILRDRVRRNDADLFREAIPRSKNGDEVVTGVYPHKSGNKWQVSIRYRGSHKHLGLFTSQEEAVAARRAFDQASDEQKAEMILREVMPRKPSGPDTVTGVYRHKKTRWQLSIKYKGKRRYMGSFQTYEEAAEVRRAFDRATEEQKEKILNGDAA